MNVVQEFHLDRDNFTWQDLSMCEGINPFNPNIKDRADIFFEESESNLNVEAATKSICDYCPVKEMCKRDAIETKAHGVRGGELFAGGRIVEH